MSAIKEETKHPTRSGCCEECFARLPFFSLGLNISRPAPDKVVISITNAPTLDGVFIRPR